MGYLHKTEGFGPCWFAVCDCCGEVAPTDEAAAKAGTVPSGWSSADVRPGSSGPYTRKLFCPGCRPHRLTCACCGAATRGRQWWNRDKGFGLCDDCIEFASRSTSPAEMSLNYGERGVHYGLKGEV